MNCFREWPWWAWFLIGFQCCLVSCKLSPHPLPWPWWIVLLPLMAAVFLFPFAFVYYGRRIFGFRGDR